MPINKRIIKRINNIGFKLRFVILILLLFPCCTLCAQQLTSRQVKNLTAFAKLYGYTKYFHPSDQAQRVFWGNVAIKGCVEMLTVKNDEQLVTSLKNLFGPIAPSIKIYRKGQVEHFSLSDLNVPDTASTNRTIFWQHLGLKTDNLLGEGTQSVRVNGKMNNEDSDLLDLFNSIDVRKYSGMNYVIDVTLTPQEENQDINYSVSLWNTSGNNGQLNAKSLNRMQNRYLYKGEITDSIQALSLRLAIQQRLPTKVNIECYVLRDDGKEKIPISNLASTKTDLTCELELSIYEKDSVSFPLFDDYLRVGDYSHDKLVKDIDCIIPLALYGDNNCTYPTTPPNEIKTYIEGLKFGDKYKKASLISFPEIRLANIVMLWNVLKYGYAYWDDASLPPKDLLEYGLKNGYTANTENTFYQTLQEMGAFLNDGHVFVTCPYNLPDSLGLPLHLMKADKKILVSNILDSVIKGKISLGDEILKINGQPVDNVLEKRISLISGSEQNKRSRALAQLSNGPEKSIILSVKSGRLRKDVTLERTVKAQNYLMGSQFINKPNNGWLKPKTFYLDLTTTSFSASLIPVFEHANNIIFDVRGYPDDTFHNLLPYLLDTMIEASRFYSSKILRPTDKSKYTSGSQKYTPQTPKIKAKVYFLVDATTQSSPETVLGIIKDFHLGTIVGEPTSGANGNMQTFMLYGGYNFSYSGIIVKNSDGGKHHNIGILPDVTMKPKQEWIESGKDTILSQTLEMLDSCERNNTVISPKKK